MRRRYDDFAFELFAFDSYSLGVSNKLLDRVGVRRSS